MIYEVELKAWVEDREVAETDIRRCCTFESKYLKDDRYFRSPVTGNTTPRALRVRIQADSAVVTYKDKTIRDSFEVNLEKEFSVSDPELFVDLLEQSGFELIGKKTKRGLRFSYEDTTVELSDVDGLGTFIEVEQLVTGGKPDDIEQAKRTIQKVFEMCKGNPGKIEPVPYLELLGFRVD